MDDTPHHQHHHTPASPEPPPPPSLRRLRSVQTGVIAETLVALEILRASRGRLVPCRPVADDDGVDLVIYDKLTTRALSVQVKSRTTTLRDPRSGKPNPRTNFEVRRVVVRSWGR